MALRKRSRHDHQLRDAIARWNDPEADRLALTGGVANLGAVVRIGPYVFRPTGTHTLAVHAFLGHLHEAGFSGVPDVVGADDENREILVFIPGEVAEPPFPAWAQSEEALASVALLLRRFHEAAASFERPPDAAWSKELADPSGDEIVCHNDVCPENVVFRDGEACGLLDFDFAAPGRRLWDVAAAAGMWIPLEDPESAATTGRRDLDPFARLAVFCDAYGLGTEERTTLVDVVMERRGRGPAFVRRHVEAGHPGFTQMWNEHGGAARYERIQRWLSENRAGLVAAAQRA